MRPIMGLPFARSFVCKLGEVVLLFGKEAIRRISAVGERQDGETQGVDAPDRDLYSGEMAMRRHARRRRQRHKRTETAGVRGLDSLQADANGQDAPTLSLLMRRRTAA